MVPRTKIVQYLELKWTSYLSGGNFQNLVRSHDDFEYYCPLLKALLFTNLLLLLERADRIVLAEMRVEYYEEWQWVQYSDSTLLRVIDGEGHSKHEDKIKHVAREAHFVKVKYTAKRSRSVSRYRRYQDESTLTSYMDAQKSKTAQKRAFSKGTLCPTRNPGWANQKNQR